MYELSLLRSNRRFRALWAVEAADTVASGLADVALPWFVLTVTGSPLGLGVAFALRSAPDVLVSPLVGGLIDRQPRSRLLAAGHAGTALLTALLPALFSAGRLAAWELYAAMVGLSVTASLAHNTSRAALPGVVPEERLDPANALLMGTRTGGRLVFLLAGGALTVAVGPAVVLAGAAGGSMLAAAAGRLSSLGSGGGDGGDGSLRRFRAGLGAISSRPTLLWLLALGVLYNAAVAPFGSVVFPATASALGGAGALTALLACWRGGAAAGNALAGRWSTPTGTKMASGAAVVGAGTLAAAGLLAAAPPALGPTARLALVAGALLVAGLGQPLFNVPGSSLLQSAAPEGSRGTVVTAHNSLLQASFPVPLLAAGALLERLAPGLLLGAAGAGLLALAGLTAVALDAPGWRAVRGPAAGGDE